MVRIVEWKTNAKWPFGSTGVDPAMFNYGLSALRWCRLELPCIRYLHHLIVTPEVYAVIFHLRYETCYSQFGGNRDDKKWEMKPCYHTQHYQVEDRVRY